MIQSVKYLLLLLKCIVNLHWCRLFLPLKVNFLKLQLKSIEQQRSFDNDKENMIGLWYGHFLSEFGPSRSNM